MYSAVLKPEKDLPALTNLDLLALVDVLEIKYFRGIFMRDSLPPQGIEEKEVGKVNLDSSSGKGTHWVCYSRNEKKIYYFDSFGLDPPIELQKYLKDKNKKSVIECQHFFFVHLSVSQIYC
ncbi:unnamed protein product [Auanema sp. JU1783]|nr:unnamed protein product [Auanema sp. JU1783]